MSIASAIQAASGMSGSVWAQYSLILGNSISTWLPTVSLTGITTGNTGSGNVNGVFSLADNPMLIASSLQGYNFAGVNVPQIVTGISSGLAVSLTGMGYQGVSTGVGNGTDASTVTVADPIALANLIAMGGFNGVLSPSLALAIANGVSALILTGTGIGTVTGASGPFPSSGVSSSQLV
jgi:hypothetical protein